MPIKSSQTELIEYMDGIYSNLFSIDLIKTDEVEEKILQIDTKALNKGQLYKYYLLLSQIYNFRSEFTEAIETADKAFELSDSTEMKHLLVENAKLQCDNYYSIGNYDQAVKYGKDAWELVYHIKDQKNRRIKKADILKLLGVTYLVKGEFDAAYDSLETGLNLITEYQDNIRIASFTLNIAIIHSIKADHVAALEMYKKALTVSDNLNHLRLMSNVRINMANTYLHLGEFKEAITYSKEALAIYEEMNNRQSIAAAIHNIGNIYKAQGEIGTALEYFYDSLRIKREIGNMQHIAYTLHSIAITKMSQNELSEAKELLLEALEIKDGIGNLVDISSTLFHLCLLAILENDVPKINLYLIRFQTLTESSEEAIILSRFEIIKAYNVKERKIDSSQNEAMETFQHFISSSIKEDALVVFSMVNIIDIMIQNYITSGDTKILNAISTRISEILRISRHQESYILFLESMILQSRFKMLTSEFNDARDLISKALRLASSKQLEYYVNQISAEIDKMSSQIDTITDLLAKQTSAEVLINELEIVDIVRNKIMKRSGIWGGQLSL